MARLASRPGLPTFRGQITEGSHKRRYRDTRGGGGKGIRADGALPLPHAGTGLAPMRGNASSETFSDRRRCNTCTVSTKFHIPSKVLIPCALTVVPSWGIF